MFSDRDIRWTYKSKKGKPLTKKQFENQVQKITREMHATTKPFPDDSPAAKRERTERAARDFEYFCHTYLPHYFYKPFGQIHKELVGYIETGGKSLNAVAYPREHGKSAIASFAKPLQMALCGISPYTIILSDTNDLAAEMIQWIKIEVEENARIKQDFGNDLVTHGWWEKDDIVIAGRYRIRGMGHRQKVRGTRFMQHRPFYIVIDDLENDINVRNKQLVKEKLEWILGAVYGSMDDNGTLLMVGTMLDKDSVLSRLVKHIEDKAEEFETLFHIKAMNAAVYSAIIDEGTPNERPVWPEGKTLEGLKKIKFTVGEIVWAAEFQNQPIDQGAYKLEWIQGYNRSIFISTASWVYFSGSDASARDEEKNDCKAHVVVAKKVDNDLKRYVADAWIRKQGINDFFQAFIDLYVEYQMNLCAFEINNFQIFVKWELERLCREKQLWPNIHEVTQKMDKYVRCTRHVGMAQRGDLLFCRGYKDIEILITQLNLLGTKANDDGPDAMDMALEASMNWRGKFTFKSAGKREISGSTGRGYTKRPSFSARRELLG